MRAITLDYQRTSGVAAGGLIVLAIGCLAALLVALDYRAVTSEREELSDYVQRMENLSLRNTPSPRPAVAPEGAQQAQAVQNKLQVPWESVFAAVEQADDKDVALLSLNPDADRGVVAIAGEARDFPAVLAYIQRLKASPVLTSVSLVNHEVVEQQGQRAVKFSLLAKWSRS